MQILITSLFFLGCVLPAVTSAAATARIPVQATITAVTVYQDRAQVTRTATVRIKPGSQIIAIEGLPVLLQDDSVRVDAQGTARPTITGIEVKRSFLAQTAEKRVKELEQELKQLERKRDSLDAKKAGLGAQRGFIDSIKVAWGERISHQLAIGKPTASELTDALGFVGTGMTRVEEQSRELDAEKLLITARMDALKRQKKEATGSHRKESKTVEVTLENTREGSLTIELSGVLGQATWEPVYDVRLLEEGTVAELTYRGQVRQQTGEDWNNVRLTLSTARPASGGAPPELSPWRIALYRPMPMAMPAPAPRIQANRFKKAAAPMIAESVADAAMAEEMPPAPAPFQTAHAASEGSSVVFRIPKPVAVTSDNTPHSTVIALEKLPVTTEYVTVPKLSSTVYLTAELVNRAGWPLLPGSVKIFSGNTFVGSAGMKQVAAGEKFTLPFGSDDQITIKREELKQHKEAGLFGKNRVSYRYRIELDNLRKEPQIITVKDQLPLAGDSEIKVSLEEPTVIPTEKKDDGVLVWKLKLGPGEKKSLGYDIIVEYPKEREITGL